MEIYDNIRYIDKRPRIYHDGDYIYVVNDQIEVMEHVGTINEFIGYEAQIVRYHKDEYIELLTNENIKLNDRVSKLESNVKAINEILHRTMI